MFSIEGKFAEPSIWYRHIKENFFGARGYALEGEMTIIGEGEPGYREVCEKSAEKYRQWKFELRMKEKINKGNGLYPNSVVIV